MPDYTIISWEFAISTSAAAHNTAQSECCCSVGENKVLLCGSEILCCVNEAVLLVKSWNVVFPLHDLLHYADQ